MACGKESLPTLPFKGCTERDYTTVILNFELYGVGLARKDPIPKKQQNYSERGQVKHPWSDSDQMLEQMRVQE